MTTLAERVREVLERVAAAAVASGRPADCVTVVAAAKAQPVELQEAICDLGVRHLGHNYVQDAAAARAVVRRAVTWHCIGHLQRNKAGQAVELFDVIDSLDQAALAAALARRVESAGRSELPVLLQVRLGGEPSKSGVAPEEAGRLLEAVQQTGRLRCLGLMTVPPPAEPTEGRRWFAELRRLAEALRADSGLVLPVLSMGMSGDYEAAIAEGSTQVRIGTALFGRRTK